MPVMILTPSEKRRVVELAKTQTQTSIAKRFKVSRDTIRRVLIELEHKLPEVEQFKQTKAVKATEPSWLVKPTEPKNTKIDPKDVIWSASSKYLSITIGRETYNADSTYAKFKEACTACVEGNFDLALSLINTKVALESFVSGNVKIENDRLFYKDLEIKSGLTDRIIECLHNGQPFSTLINFFENLMENPSRRAVYRLYDFLSANDIKITKDGYFIAWKKVRPDFKDIWSGTFDNSPGKVVSMPRNQVNEDDTVTCSAGLHVCSRSYLTHFGSTHDKVILVKVNPKDVVSIPVDYNNAKMRTCRYEVIGEANL